MVRTVHGTISTSSDYICGEVSYTTTMSFASSPQNSNARTRTTRSAATFAGIGAVAMSLMTGCPSMPAPQYPFAKASNVITQLEATQSCGRNVQASAKIDFFGKQGRFRGDLLLFAGRAANLRLDAVSPFGVALATLTSDGNNFALADLREKAFYVGPAEPCNIARLTSVPIPGPALVDLLRGSAPLITHDRSSLIWSGRGYYEMELLGQVGSERLRIGVHPDDVTKPTAQQRMRLLDVLVRNGETVLYHAELDGHSPASMATARVDDDGVEPPIPPSGPECHAEAPRTIHLEVPADDKDVIFRYDKVTWNPPLPANVFQQSQPSGMPLVRVNCTR
jgi:hypothetical protein